MSFSWQTVATAGVLSLLAPSLLVMAGCGGCNRNANPAAKQGKGQSENGSDTVQSRKASGERAGENGEEEEELAIRPLVEPPDTDPFSPQVLEAVRELVRADAVLQRDDEGHVIAVTLAEASDEETVRHAGQLGTLQRLVANNCTVTDESIAAWSNLDQLRELELGGVEFSLAGAQALGNLAGLKSLMLSGSSLSPDHLPPLSQLENLEKLDASWTNIGDDGLHQFQQFSSLRELDLSYTPVSDSQLRKLAKVPQLERLILFGTDVTQAGVETLQQEKSGLEVIH